MDLGVADKAFLIVGGSRDMGYEAARVLAADGARVALVGRRLDAAEAAARTITQESGVRAIGLSGDASQPGAIEQVMTDAMSALTRVDGLLTTAGWVENRGTVLDASDDDFDVVYENIFMTVVRSCRAVLPYLIANGGGAIVTTSAYSIRSPNGSLHAYSAMKHAVANFTKNIAKTYGPRGIRANCVCPGAVRTAIVERMLTERAGVSGLSLTDVEGQCFTSGRCRLPSNASDDHMSSGT